MHFLVRQLTSERSALDRYGAAHDDLMNLGAEFYHKKPAGNLDDWRYEARFPENFEPDEIRKLVNQLKSRLRKNGPVFRAFADLLPKRGHFGLDLDPGRVSIED